MSVISTVLAERRKSDAVVESEATELERLEQLGDGLGLLGDQSSTSGRTLSRSEVWDARRCLVDVVRLLFNVRLYSKRFKSAQGLRCDMSSRNPASTSVLHDLPLRD